MRYIVIDLEMHPLPNKYKNEKNICKNETIEIGAVMLDEEFNEISEFKSLVKPKYCEKIYPKYEKMTGISTQMLQHADTFDTAFHQFARWCRWDGDTQIIAWSDTDFGQFIHEICLKQVELDQQEKEMMSSWRDFQKEFGAILGKPYQISLDMAMLYADVSFSGHRHDAVWDSRNTAQLFRRTRTEEDRIRVARRAESLFMTDPLGVSLGEMYNFSSLLDKCS